MGKEFGPEKNGLPDGPPIAGLPDGPQGPPEPENIGSVLRQFANALGVPIYGFVHTQAVIDGFVYTIYTKRRAPEDVDITLYRMGIFEDREVKPLVPGAQPEISLLPSSAFAGKSRDSAVTTKLHAAQINALTGTLFNPFANEAVLSWNLYHAGFCLNKDGVITQDQRNTQELDSIHDRAVDLALSEALGGKYDPELFRRGAGAFLNPSRNYFNSGIGARIIIDYYDITAGYLSSLYQSAQSYFSEKLKNSEFEDSTTQLYEKHEDHLTSFKSAIVQLYKQIIRSIFQQLQDGLSGLPAANEVLTEFAKALVSDDRLVERLQAWGKAVSGVLAPLENANIRWEIEFIRKYFSLLGIPPDIVEPSLRVEETVHRLSNFTLDLCDWEQQMMKEINEEFEEEKERIKQEVEEIVQKGVNVDHAALQSGKLRLAEAATLLRKQNSIFVARRILTDAVRDFFDPDKLYGDTYRTYSEYLPARVVILGTAAYFTHGPAINEGMKGSYATPITPTQRQIEQEYKNMERFLHRMGVEVQHPLADPQIAQQLAARDIAIVIGDTLVVSNMAEESRRREFEASKIIFEALKQQGIEFKIISPEKEEGKTEDIILEGGNVIVDGDRIIVGINNRTNEAAVRWLKKQFEPEGYRVSPVYLKKNAKGTHLDTIFKPISARAALIHPASIGRDPDHVLAGYRQIQVSDTEQAHGGCNVFSLNDSIMMIRADKELEDLRRRLWFAGYYAYHVSFTESAKTGTGGPNCAILPLMRGG